MSVFCITMAFMPERMVRRSLAAHASTRNPALAYPHYLLDQHYPIEKLSNRAALRHLAAEYGLEVLDAGRNLGLHDGFNWALQQIAPHDDDIVIAYDPDSIPTATGWDLALVRALEGSSGVNVWSSLMNPRSLADLTERGYDVGTVDGYLKTWATRTAVTNSVCAWRVGWLRKVGFLQEARPWYGHLESVMWSKLGGKRWVFLPGWPESDELRDEHDISYVHYKWAHSHLKSWDGDFESWLKAGSPLPKDTSAPDRIP